MPPTLKDADVSAGEISPTGPANGGHANEGGGRQQTVALEVPVTVNGARAVEGSDKREPFSEATKTVLVLGSGAVIRLASAVAPGQLLFLTNDKTKKEVVCQVVKSKNYASSSGYVELEFTEPVQGFWGLRFPGERTSAASPTSPTAPRAAALSPLGQDLDSRPPVASTPSKPIEPKIPAVSASDSIDEFKTEIKPDSRPMSKADFLAPADTSTQAPKIETSRLQEQLSSLLLADSNATNPPQASSAPAPSVQSLSDTATKVFEIASDEPAPQKTESAPRREEPASIPASKATLSTTPTFDAEEVKVPAWLEPLARNAAIPAPPVSVSNSTPSEFEELSAQEPQSQQPKAPKPPAPLAKHRATLPAAPVFGRTLIGGGTAHSVKTSGGNKGILIAALAAGILVVAGGATWYQRQSSPSDGNAAPSNSFPASSSAAALPAVIAPDRAPSSSAPASTIDTGTTEGVASQTKSTSLASLSGARAVPSSGSAAKVQPAAISDRVPKPAATLDVGKTPDPAEAAAEPEIRKPSLGNVHLAKPKVGHAARTAVNADAGPTLDTSGEELPAGDASSMGGLLEGSAKQPAAPIAPVPVGGDVTPARMISSVPPAYPSMAKTQHIAGDVRIDALIDANGRVSGMKIVSGPTLLHQAAMDALRQWKYQPATLDGKPVAMHLTVTIQFRLQ